jgi:uncharacterized protein (TIGR00369 family)
MSETFAARLAAVSATAAFNQWAQVEVEAAELGRCSLAMRWRPEFGQYSGLLHTGMITALLETSCGFAAGTQVGELITSQISVSFVAPAIGRHFRADASLVRAGRRQAFSDARLYARTDGGKDVLVATAHAVLLLQPECSS